MTDERRVQQVRPKCFTLLHIIKPLYNITWNAGQITASSWFAGWFQPRRSSFRLAVVLLTLFSVPETLHASEERYPKAAKPLRVQVSIATDSFNVLDGILNTVCLEDLQGISFFERLQRLQIGRTRRQENIAGIFCLFKLTRAFVPLPSDAAAWLGLRALEL